MQNNYKIILEIYKSWLFEGTNPYINLWEDWAYWKREKITNIRNEIVT